VATSMEDLGRNLRYACRQLAAKPAFTFLAGLSLALGIGANVTLFTYVNAIFLQPLPVSRPAELVGIYTTDADFPGFLQSSYLNLRDLRADRAIFSGFAMAMPIRATLRAAGGDAERLMGEIVSSDYFAMLGVRPALGRGFVPHDDDQLGGHPEVVLSYGLWQRRFGGDRGVVGSQLSLNGRPFTVVGVAPAGFHGTNSLNDRDLWLPLSMRRGIVGVPQVDWFKERGGLMLDGIGRLAPGVGERQAAAALQALAANLRRDYPDDNKGRGMTLMPLAQASLNPNSRGSLVLAGWFLMTMVGLVLALACANVANLLLARTMARRREIAVRIALGVGRGRLVRQLFTENLLLAFLGGAAGLVMAVWGRRLLWVFRPATLPESLDLSFDPRVLGFALALTLLTGLLFGLVPALQTARTDVVGALKNQAPPPRRFAGRALLVIGQIGLSLLLLIGTGLFLRSLRQAQRIDPGFDAEHLLVLSINPGAEGYGDVRGLDLCRRAEERAAGLPGVAAAALGANRPLEAGLGGRFFIDGRSSPSPQDGAGAHTTSVDPAYFATTGIRILRGRPFTAADRDGAPPVVIINATLAQRFWRGENPVGSRLRFVGSAGAFEVVGVAADAKYSALGEPAAGYLYFPLAQGYAGAATLYVRAAGDPDALVASVRDAVHRLDPNLPVTGVGPVSAILAQSLWAPRAAAAILAFFGVLGLALAAIGTYGVMSYAVDRRRREIGIRMALGAGRGEILRRVLRQGMSLALIGLLVGLLAAFGTTRLIGRFLYGISPFDALTFLLTSASLATVAVLATLVPARRATAIDPLASLRAE
jgi:predicted permease